MDLAKEWVALIGDKFIEDGEATRADGFKTKQFVFSHGKFNLACIDGGGGTIVIIGDIQLDKAYREKLTKEPDKNKVDKLFKMIAGELLGRRSGYQFQPPNSIPEIIRITQIMRIDAEMPTTFNRFVDAIQEVTNSILMTLLILHSSAPTLKTSASSTGSSFHDGMYG